MFLVFCLLLRITEGVGSAMFFTAVYALLPDTFPDNVGTLMVGWQYTGTDPISYLV